MEGFKAEGIVSNFNILLRPIQMRSLTSTADAASSSPYLRQFAVHFISLVVIFAGCLVFIYRTFNLSLNELLPAANTMPASAALGFIIAGSGFLILFYDANSPPNVVAFKKASMLSALFLSVLVLAALTEYLSGLYLSIEHLLLRRENGADASPTRMAPMSALCFLMLGGIIILQRWQPRSEYLIELLSVGLLGISGLALLACLYYPESIWQLAPYSFMAPLTAMLFALLALGTLLIQYSFSIKSLGYGLALLGVGLAFKLYLLIKESFGVSLPPFVSFYSVIILTSLLAGAGPGLFSLALAGFVVSLWVYEPIGLLDVESHSNQIALILFGANGLLINLITYLYHRNRDKFQASERNLVGAALLESEARLRAFTTASFDIVYRLSADWSEMRQLHGREFVADTLAPSRTWVETYIHPDDLGGH